MKRKIINLYIFWVISISCYSIPWIARENNCRVVYRATDNYINIRSEPNTNCKVLGQLFENDEIYINVEKSTEEWLFCYVPKIDNVAYCYADYFLYKPLFSEVYDKLINDDEKTINELRMGHIQNIPIDELIEHFSEKNNENDCLKLLKLAYETGSRTSSNESTALLEATNANYYSVVEFLLSKTEFLVEINEMPNTFGPPLYWSISNGNKELTELLLQNGANPNCRTRYGWTMINSIDEAVYKKNYSKQKGIELKELLLKYGYDKSQDCYSDEEKLERGLHVTNFELSK